MLSVAWILGFGTLSVIVKNAGDIWCAERWKYDWMNMRENKKKGIFNQLEWRHRGVCFCYVSHVLRKKCKCTCILGRMVGNRGKIMIQVMWALPHQLVTD
jgi:hypothetical protein